MLAGLAACLPDLTLVCTADRPEASAQPQRGEDRAAVHGGRHEHDPLRRDCGRPDRRRCNRRTEAAAAYRAGQRAVSRFNTG